MKRKPTLAKLLRHARGDLPITTWSKFIGIPTNALEYLERGGQPAGKTLLRIMRAFGLSAEDFTL